MVTTRLDAEPELGNDDGHSSGAEKHMDDIEGKGPWMRRLRSRRGGPTMPSRYDSKHWRDHAERMRRFACETKSEQARQMMLRIAQDYDELASRMAKSNSALGGSSL